MDNDHFIRNWQAAIVSECKRILGRDLATLESAFITSRGGLIALEMIEDHVRSRAGKPEELERYLRSEAT